MLPLSWSQLNSTSGLYFQLQENLKCIEKTYKWYLLGITGTRPPSCTAPPQPTLYVTSFQSISNLSNSEYWSHSLNSRHQSDLIHSQTGNRLRHASGPITRSVRFRRKKERESKMQGGGFKPILNFEY